AINRAEFRVALDPRPENRAEVHKIIEQEMKTLNERLEEISTTRDAEAKAMLPAIKQALAVYQKDIAETLRIADGVKDFQISEQTE
ncbi:hypothetical protein ACQ1Z3_15325, partial [Enterococcus faecalis]|uniref:hypothetical protein n=1 Tax=Enterococcus faecalis TaxID=1351 RepID=UPI003D6A8659